LISFSVLSASVLATIAGNNLLPSETLLKSDLVNMCASFERFIGTEGGAMDQAICLLGETGAAKLIGFSPLTVNDVKLPKHMTFVVTHSLASLFLVRLLLSHVLFPSGRGLQSRKSAAVLQ
jgi:N-acetylgalactosamine kinase